jgi:hypothetical protein
MPIALLGTERWLPDESNAFAITLVTLQHHRMMHAITVLASDTVGSFCLFGSVFCVCAS